MARAGESPSPEWLRAHVRAWAGAGVITETEGDAIMRFERQAESEAAPARVPLVAELVVYLGSVFALAGGTFIVGRFWDELGAVGRLSIAAVLSSVGLLAGRALVRIGDDGARRLGSFAWLLGTGGVALGAGVLAVQFGSDSENVTALVVGASVAVVSGALWRNLDRPLQLLTTLAGTVVVALTLGDLLDLPPWIPGVAVALLGVGLLTLAYRSVVAPVLVAKVAGAVLAMAGLAAVTDLHRGLGLTLGLAAASVVVALGLRGHEVALVVAGVLGFLQYLQVVLATYFAGAFGSLILLAGGLAAVVTAVAVILRKAGRGGGPLPTGGPA